jgi:hypothetical protein
MFYFDQGGNLPFFQCKVSCFPSMSMKEIEGLNIIFTNFNIPVFTRRLRLCEAALYLHEKITFLSFPFVFNQSSEFSVSQKRTNKLISASQKV